MKLPAPPIPDALKPAPKRPGTGKPKKPLDHAKEAGISAVDWVDERTSIAGGVRWVLFRKVPKGTNWFYTLGSASMFAFLSQAMTGVFLAMYYTPSPTQAYESARHITNDVFLGEFVRGMHKWGSTVMVILIVLTLLMGFTGYLLPFDQRSYWATIVGVNLNSSGPIVGPYLADFLRGGPEFGAYTLSRFYALHMLLIPGLIAALIGVHLYLVVKLGTTAPPWLKAKLPEPLEKENV